MLALAPDTSSQRAAGRLADAAPWSCWGASGDLLWGACAGSGQAPYQVAELQQLIIHDHQFNQRRSHH